MMSALADDTDSKYDMQLSLWYNGRFQNEGSLYSATYVYNMSVDALAYWNARPQLGMLFTEVKAFSKYSFLVLNLKGIYLIPRHLVLREIC